MKELLRLNRKCEYLLETDYHKICQENSMNTIAVNLENATAGTADV